MLAGLHNPQGRVVALLRLISLGPEDVLAILPRELVPAVVARLSKYVLRAKVKITDVSGEWQIVGIVDDTAPAASEQCAVVRVCENPARWWIAARMSEASRPAVTAAPEGFAPLDREGWRALDIAAEVPQVYTATSEEFVAQMLNLDTLGAIAFDKGCYTGQEVIARAHYRGRVKRRAQRFHVAEENLSAGASGTLPDGRSFKVVEAVRSAIGGSDVLAVASLATEEEAAQPGATTD